MARLNDESGISDILAIAFMLLFAIFAGVLLHAYRFDAVVSATDRQIQLKSEYLYRTLELTQVENYSLTYFQGIAENLIGVGETIISGDVLHNGIENVVGYLRPSGYGVSVKLEYENGSWTEISPVEAVAPGAGVTQFTFSGKVTIIIAEAGENRVAQVDATVSIFKV